MSSTGRNRERLRRGAIGALALSLGLLTAGLAAEVLAAQPGLPLGKNNLKEQRRTVTLAPGVRLTRISRGVGVADARQMSATRNGPWRVRVLTINPKAATGHLQSTFGPDLGRSETTTSMTRFADALAGTNGGFFSIYSDSASRGNPVGLAVHDGEVESEPTDYGPETHFLLDAATNAARVTKVDWEGELTHMESGTSIFLSHVNEPPRIPDNCGGRKDPLTCTRMGEVTVFTGEWGPITPTGAGIEVVLDSAGCLVSTAMTRGVTLSAGQTSVQATGLKAVSLLELVALGCLERTDTLTDPAGLDIPLTPSTFGVNGRYQLVRAGTVVAPTGSDPFLARNPRTVAGVTADRKVILFTIDGRSGTSVGATLKEAGQVAKALGMVEAINLDGGGSSTMAIEGALANSPSDGRERPVGDALVYLETPWRPEL